MECCDKYTEQYSILRLSLLLQVLRCACCYLPVIISRSLSSNNVAENVNPRVTFPYVGEDIPTITAPSQEEQPDNTSAIQLPVSGELYCDSLAELSIESQCSQHYSQSYIHQIYPKD